MKDRVGIGWRPELAAGILCNAQQIDVVELIADDLFGAPKRQVRAMQTLATQVPVVLHGVSLGLASAAPVDVKRLDKIARVVGALAPSFWSEHLAFVRADGIEIGHLAAPPRTEETIEGAATNVKRATSIVGSAPLLENVATLIDPPGSCLDEPTWISRVLSQSDGQLLLDLNNLHANAVNFGYDPVDFLTHIPFDRVRAVHLAGGKWISSTNGERRLLDDHLHDVPDAVYALLTEVARRAMQPLTVILERDGAYPPFAVLLAQLVRAREAIAEGRSQRVEQPTLHPVPRGAWESRGQGPSLEAYLARLYVDDYARRRFLIDPVHEARCAGLGEDSCESLARVDRVGLELAAKSFARKRSLTP